MAQSITDSNPGRAQMYFTADEVADLNDGLVEVHQKFHALRERFVRRTFRTAAAREHADHGFSRRLSGLVRCIDRVFEVLPPDRADIPERDERYDATINIQAFVMNVFGCCENLAWIWVLEREIRHPNGGELPRGWVGLGREYRIVRNSFSIEFRDYLVSRQAWFGHVKDFRDALAHQIPLYIPPFTVAPEDGARWVALEGEIAEAIARLDWEEVERAKARQMGLARFQPIMTHSLGANAAVVVFHAQLLADFNTIHEIAERFLEELDR